MRPLYRVFSKSMLGYITVMMLLLTIFLAVVTFEKIRNTGLTFITDLYFIPVFLFVILLLFDAWISTSSILPVIKIDNHGIKAYSLFWKKEFAWDDVKTVYLLLAKSHLKGARWAQVSFERTGTPEQVSSFKNKGTRVSTFIIVSSKSFKPKANLLLSINLLSHHKITAPTEIAFEFEPVAWQAIQSFAKKTTHT